MRRTTAWMLVLAIAAGTACRPAAESATNDDKDPRPVLLVGIDGLEWDVMIPMLHSGRLPNLARMMQRGAYGQLATLEPTASPIIWTTIVTGRAKEAHGILGFVDRSGGGERLYTHRDRKIKALWDISSGTGLRAGVVGWWMTYPVAPIDGVIVAQTNTPVSEVRDGKTWKGNLLAGVDGQVYPPEQQAEILSVVSRVEADLPRVLEEAYGPGATPVDPLARRLWDKCEWAFRADEIYRRVGVTLLGQERFDLFAIYFGSPDVVGHRFWRYREPQLFDRPPSQSEIDALSDYVELAYAHADRVIGELLAAAPDDSNVLIVSDHGMLEVNTAAEFRPDDLTRRLRSGGHPNAPPGVLVAMGPDIVPSRASVGPDRITRADLPTIGSVFDITPTVLALLGLPVGRDMDGQVIDDLLEPAYLASHPVRSVDSHTPDGWYASRWPDAESIDVNEERLDQLRALGYLGD